MNNDCKNQTVGSHVRYLVEIVRILKPSESKILRAILFGRFIAKVMSMICGSNVVKTLFQNCVWDGGPSCEHSHQLLAAAVWLLL